MRTMKSKSQKEPAWTLFGNEISQKKRDRLQRTVVTDAQSKCDEEPTGLRSSDQPSHFLIPVVRSGVQGSPSQRIYETPQWSSIWLQVAKVRLSPEFKVSKIRRSAGIARR